ARGYRPAGTAGPGQRLTSAASSASFDLRKVVPPARNPSAAGTQYEITRKTMIGTAVLVPGIPYAARMRARPTSVTPRPPGVPGRPPASEDTAKLAITWNPLMSRENASSTSQSVTPSRASLAQTYAWDSRPGAWFTTDDASRLRTNLGRYLFREASLPEPNMRTRPTIRTIGATITRLTDATWVPSRGRATRSPPPAMMSRPA